MAFRKDFLWGAASAAYQIEGAHNEDGKGPSIWDALSAGHIKHGESGNISCDHYHHWREDVQLMQKLGLKAYRFSVSWPRVMPEEGKINRKGLQFYIDLVEELTKAGIEPMCTLFHWDTPLWVHEKGGWKNEAVADYFADYVRVVVEALSHRVKYWMTVNEPAGFIGVGYIVGIHAPFESWLDRPEEESIAQAARLTRNALLAHGRAVQVIRQTAKMPPKIGAALCGSIYLPEGDTPEAVEEARARTFTDTIDRWAVFNHIHWWGDPMVLGTAAEPVARLLSERDWEIIRQPLDFFGLNSYNAVNYEDYQGERSLAYPGMPRTAMDWPITPDVLYWAAKFIPERYGLPILFTENGMANLDFVMSDGQVHDPQRVDFMQRYLASLKRAVEEGAEVLGYLYWSILDNFEWAEGYDKRFGLIHVDYRTGKRTPKDSFFWYAETIGKNGENLA